MNGATGVVTNVAKTNTAQTFTQLQSFSAGISASGATFISGSTIKFDGSGNLTSTSNLNIGDAFNTTSIGDYNGDGNSTYIFVNDGSNQLFLSNPSDSVVVSGNVDLTTGTLILPNDEYIQNSTNGRVDIMPAPISASAYGMYVDTTSWTFGVKLGTVRSSDGTLNVGSFLYDTNCNMSDDKDFTFGASSYYTLSQRSSSGQQCLSIGLLTGDQNSSSSGSLVLVQNNQRTSSNRIPTTDHAHPTLYIYAGGSTADDYVRINHDTSNATIATGDGSIILDPANSVVVIDGGLTASGGATFAASIGSNSSTVDLLNSVVSTINFGGVSGSTINLGNTSGNSTIDLNTNVIRDLELRSYFESKAVGVYTGGMVQTWTLDLSQAQVFTITTSGNISTIAVNNTPSKSNTSVGFTTVITQGGGHTISWASWSPGTLKWAGGVGPSLTATAGKTDIFSFVTYDGGTNWYGFVGGQNF